MTHVYYCIGGIDWGSRLAPYTSSPACHILPPLQHFLQYIVVATRLAVFYGAGRGEVAVQLRAGCLKTKRGVGWALMIVRNAPSACSQSLFQEVLQIQKREEKKNSTSKTVQ